MIDSLANLFFVLFLISAIIIAFGLLVTLTYGIILGSYEHFKDYQKQRNRDIKRYVKRKTK